MKLRIIQDLQCPKCGNKLSIKEVAKWNTRPYCDNCDTIWEIMVKPSDEHIRIEYKEIGGDAFGEV